MARLEQRLASLQSMSATELRLEWQRLMNTLPPKLSPELMRLALAHKLQERMFGGISSALSRDVKAGGPCRQPRMKLKPGTRLIRSWNGRTIEVVATPDGYSHQDRAFRSLSHIAREVTGTSWSGPRFFGLKASS